MARWSCQVSERSEDRAAGRSSGPGGRLQDSKPARVSGEESEPGSTDGAGCGSQSQQVARTGFLLFVPGIPGSRAALPAVAVQAISLTVANGILTGAFSGLNLFVLGGNTATHDPSDAD